jgi:hypothetical protein
MVGRAGKLRYDASALTCLTTATEMTTVSLCHIAGGVKHITHGAVPAWQAWAMELAGVVAAMQHVRDRLHRLSIPG